MAAEARSVRSGLANADHLMSIDLDRRRRTAAGHYRHVKQTGGTSVINRPNTAMGCGNGGLARGIPEDASRALCRGKCDASGNGSIVRQRGNSFLAQ